GRPLRDLSADCGLVLGALAAARCAPGVGRLFLLLRKQRGVARWARAGRTGEFAMSAGRALLPYGRQAIDDDDVAAVAAALRSDFLTTGPLVQAFESEGPGSVARRRLIGSEPFSGMLPWTSRTRLLANVIGHASNVGNRLSNLARVEDMGAFDNANDAS